MSALDPCLAIRKASIAAMKASATLVAALGAADRIHDAIPPDAAFPYITYDHGQALPDDGDDCDLGAECYLTWSVWSRVLGTVEAETIAGLVAGVLNTALAVDGFRIVVHQVTMQHMKDPDDLTSHSVVVARYETAPTA